MTGPSILVGFAEAISAPESVWSLVDAGFRPVVFHREGQRGPLAGFRGIDWVEVPHPETSPAACIDALADVAKHRSIAATLPLDDASLWLLQRVRRDHGTPMAGAPDSAIDVALDKALQIEAARKAGFEVPRTLEFSTLEGLADYDTAPAFLKPSLAARLDDGRLVRGMGHFCRTRDEVRRVARKWDPSEPALAQSFHEGIGEGIFGFASAEGVMGWCGHRRIRMMNPNGSGSSACESLAVSQDLKEKIARFLADIGWRGLFMIEMLRDREGTPWFMELNGRCWGSMALARRLGFEYPAWTVRQALDPGFVPEVPPEADRRIVCRHLGREIVHLLFVLRGSRGRGVIGWPGRWETVKNLLRFEDSTYWYNRRPGEGAVFWADAYQTVINQVFKDRS